MTDHPDLMRRLREALADLYGNPVSARRVADDIGLDATQFVTVGVLKDVWHSILREAERQGKVEDLLALALSEYPRRADLAALAVEYRAMSPVGTEPARAGPKPQPGRPFMAEAVPPVGRQQGPKRAWLLPGLGLAAVVVVVGLVVRSLIGGTAAPIATATQAAAALVTPTAPPQAAPPTTVLRVATTAPAPTETVAPSPTATPAPEAGATVDGPNGMVLVYVLGGPFRMGSEGDDPEARDDEKPQHEVDLEAFWISRTEVTNAQYARCVAAGACSAPRNEEYDKPDFSDRPVTGVIWYQANTYAQWVGGRLPTEAEWEKACRGTDGRIYPWGNDAPTAERLNYNLEVGHTTDVGSYPAGAYGLFDMAGNVWEWTASLYRPYPYESDDGREDPEAEGYRMVRGGSWGASQRDVRCAWRDRDVPAGFGDIIGFRVVVSLSSSGF